MSKSIFDPQSQQNDLRSKIVVGLERISEAIRVLLWEHAKKIGLSPIQIQILIFIKYHDEALCNVSHLAREFNVTKPTISDAIKALEKKALIRKRQGYIDARSYSISLSAKGTRLVKSIEGFASPIEDHLQDFAPEQLEGFFRNIAKLISKLNEFGIISVQRICFLCKFYEKKSQSHYCNLLKKDLLDDEIRLDCPEYEKKPTGNLA